PVVRGATGAAAKAVARPTPSAATPKRGDHRAQNEERRRQRERERLEKEIEGRETRVKAIEVQLADPELYHDAARSKEIVTEYERGRAELEALWQRLPRRERARR